MLPTLIEYLCSQEMPVGRGRICRPGRLSGLVTVPPNFRLPFQIAPMGWVGIKYATGFTNIPETLNAFIYQAGDNYFSGLITPEQIIELIGYYVVFTHAAPISVVLENPTNLNQQLTFTQWQLIIDSEENFNLVREHLREFSASTSNELAREANKLLDAIDKKLGRGM